MSMRRSTYHNIATIPCISDATSPVASFNDSRCAAGGVCATDPLLFTCELTEVIILRVVFPNGDREHFSVNVTAAAAALPDGFNIVSLNITEIDESTRNYSLTLFITNASFLNGGKITCDDTTPTNIAEAGCPFVSMLIHLMYVFHIIIVGDALCSFSTHHVR